MWTGEIVGVGRKTMSIVGKAGVGRKTMGIVFLVIGALLVAYLTLTMAMASDVGAEGGGSGSKASEGEITNAEITGGGGYDGEILRKEQFKRH